VSFDIWEGERLIREGKEVGQLYVSYDDLVAQYSNSHVFKGAHANNRACRDISVEWYRIA